MSTVIVNEERAAVALAVRKSFLRTRPSARARARYEVTEFQQVVDSVRRSIIFALNCRKESLSSSCFLSSARAGAIAYFAILELFASVSSVSEDSTVVFDLRAPSSFRTSRRIFSLAFRYKNINGNKFARLQRERERGRDLYSTSRLNLFERTIIRIQI